MEVTMRVGKPLLIFTRQNGFTFVAVLAAMLIAAMAAQAVVLRVTQQDMREREDQLLRVGQAYRMAIKEYYEMTPGSAKQWPRTLEDLTDDKRFVVIRRHLRDAYPDPITRSMDWGLISNGDGGISGVYSTSLDSPIKTARVRVGDVVLPEITQYSDRRFEYVPEVKLLSTKP
jgi:type II secretory pathway pseudopilin PulG